ncbi:hypothetical protein EDB83DRAFT_2347565 [Lactarius deliciosus]|nr:hypothetical protein EDB83DRAFT_2347565 [Lactarius deliciosus]
MSQFNEQEASSRLSPQRDASSGSARQERLTALERRLNRGASPLLDAVHDPQAEIALRSLHTLSTIAENLLREPDNPKFRQFKPTNTIIKRDIVDPKGTLEYAVAGKEEDEGLKVRMAKTEEELRIKRAKEAFMEDRRAQALRTERERKIRSQEGVAQAQSPVPGGLVDDLGLD